MGLCFRELVNSLMAWCGWRIKEWYVLEIRYQLRIGEVELASIFKHKSYYRLRIVLYIRENWIPRKIIAGRQNFVILCLLCLYHLFTETSLDVLNHIILGRFTGTGAIAWLPPEQSNINTIQHGTKHVHNVWRVLFVVCHDKNPSCPGWADRGECDGNAGYMMAFCHKSCGICGGGKFKCKYLKTGNINDND